jgi:hypothetical protein
LKRGMPPPPEQSRRARTADRGRPLLQETTMTLEWIAPRLNDCKQWRFGLRPLSLCLCSTP